MGGLDYPKENIIFGDTDYRSLSRMIIIGLTGGIASGKSTVSAKLVKLGAEIIDADCIARAVVEPGQKAWRDIIDTFGEGILHSDGTIDRKKLGTLVFGDDKKRMVLEAITHGEILSRVKQRIIEARNKGKQVAVLDVPLLIEAGWVYLADTIWLVYVERNTQLERLIKRDTITLQEAELRLEAQMPLEVKRKYADIIIDNSGSPEETEAQIMQAWEGLH
jgi:dephospho-CoA kinase